MEEYYSKREYKEMQNSLMRKIKSLEKKIARLEETNKELKSKVDSEYSFIPDNSED